jgi:stage V sporulation protein G
VEITEVKVFLVNEDKLKAFVSIVLDQCFMVNDIKVIQGREGLFISMPSRRKKNGEFKDVAHPLNNRTRSWMEERILGEYGQALTGGSVPTASLETAAKLVLPAPEVTVGAEVENERSLEEVQRRHLKDSFWSVG